MPTQKIECGFQIKVAWLAFVLFLAVTCFFLYPVIFSENYFATSGTGKYATYLILGIVSSAFVLLFLVAFAFRFKTGKTYIVFEDDYFEIPASVLKPKRKIFYKDITHLGNANVAGSKFTQFRAGENGRLMGFSNRLFTSEADYELAMKILVEKIKSKMLV